jgi:Kdo-III transferase WaaZ
MTLNKKTTNKVELNVSNQFVSIEIFDASEPTQILRNQAVNIIASGPSVTSLAISDICQEPTIFVNGSISLTAKDNFSHIVGYVISDARFVSHQPDIIQEHYSGQPLYATLAVFEAIATFLPDLILTYHHAMRLIYPVDRPLSVRSKKPWLHRLFFARQLLNKKKLLTDFEAYSNFVVDSSYQPQPIGVSLDITYGFVEAGTVAYVATQLAFSRQASTIHLYGIDLINNHQPRFYEDKNNTAPCKLDKAITNRIVPSFDLLATVYKEHGVLVYNHSSISKSLFQNLIYAV